MNEYKRGIDVVGKIEWEGGIHGALVYGLTHEDIDEEALPELRAAWKKLEEAWRDYFQPAVDAVELLLPPDL